MDLEVTEFDELDPTSLHLVGQGANRFPPLLAKAAAAVEYESFVKAKYSADDLRRLLSEGHAMRGPNGNIDYPIDDNEDLENAIHAVGRGNASHDKIRRYIIGRAKDMGKTDEIPDDWNSDGSLSKGHEPVTGDMLAQSRANNPKAGAVEMDNAQDEGQPPAACYTPPPGDLRRGDGQGDTAPDKDLHRGEALSQTRAASKAESAPSTHDEDMTGDKAPGGKRDAKGARSEAGEQTKDNAPHAASGETAPERAEQSYAMGKAGSANTPGSPAWEDKDVALADKASKLLEQALKLVRQFEAREKAEAAKALPEGTEQAIRDAAAAFGAVAASGQATTAKELEDMTQDELIKLLDERDESARRAERKAAKKAEKKAEAKKAARKARKDKVAKGADKASKAASGAADDPVAATLQAIAERLTKVESEPVRPAPMLNGAGAIHRGQPMGGAFKELEDRVASAHTFGERQEAQKRLTMAKMVANENARVANPALRNRFGGSAVPLVSKAHELGDDPQVRGI